ncbi:septation protein SepH [Schaalia vaccimaxillae]|uniref:septation protein SepH n=1 Tax=Schaalia vaccimaxillae TaxID=183916 RepID=UPI0003B5A423|nr:septation protein SepH [Schaalia vaccimaxillae]
MIELELLGVGGDGESLVFTDENGERYSVQITDELRGATRRDRPRIEAAPSIAAQALRPREIQSMLRAGATVEEIASGHGMDPASVRRFEAPVQAEKNYALQRALASTVGNTPDGPTMGDLVVDRLAARGVDPDSLEWKAQREASGPWQICLTFVQGAAERGAHWLLTSGGGIEAVDQEAQWLTETVSQTPAASIFTPLPAPERDEADLEEVRAREAILDQLNAARGKRQEIEYDLDEDEGFDEIFGDDAEADSDEDSSDPAPSTISARIYSIAQARTKDQADRGPLPTTAQIPEVATDSGESKRMDPSVFWLPDSQVTPVADSPVEPVLEEKAGEAEASGSEDVAQNDALPGLETLDASEAPKKKAKKGRRSVPSWDEIVFGSKPKN